jgi:hypothetical protein
MDVGQLFPTVCFVHTTAGQSPVLLRELMKSFLKRAGGLLRPQPLNAVPSFGKQGSSSGFEALVTTNAAGRCSQCRRSGRARLPSPPTRRASRPLPRSLRATERPVALACRIEHASSSHHADSCRQWDQTVRQAKRQSDPCLHTLGSGWYPWLWRIATFPGRKYRDRLLFRMNGVKLHPAGVPGLRADVADIFHHFIRASGTYVAKSAEARGTAFAEQMRLHTRRRALFEVPFEYSSERNTLRRRADGRHSAVKSESVSRGRSQQPCFSTL